MSVIWFPKTMTRDTLVATALHSTPSASIVRMKTRRYILGEQPPHYPVPAIPLNVDWSKGRFNDLCIFDNTGDLVYYWPPD